MRELVIKNGSAGYFVLELQKRLNLHASAGLTEDGKCGPRTMNAAARALGLKSVAALTRPMLRDLALEILLGLDVSGWNGSIDARKVVAAGASFVIVKASQNDAYTSKKAREQFRQFHEAGMSPMGYHYLDSTLTRDPKGRQIAAVPGMTDPVEDAIREVEHYLEAMAELSWGIHVPAHWGDMESGLNRPGVAADDEYNALHLATWLETLKARSQVMVGTYTGDFAEDAFLLRASEAVKKRIAAFPLWFACYSGDTEPAKLKKLEIWNKVTIWQHDGDGTFPGVAGKVDLNWALKEDLPCF